jgi:protease-4
MGADRIFADPGTITGSIGVIGMKIPLAGAMQRIGVTTDVIARGKNSGVLSTFNGYTDSERETMQKLLNEIYRQFTTKAAQGRKMPVEALEKLARGRVYTGGAALKLGLVDELGGLAEAIAHAKQLAGLKPEDKLERLDLPKAGNPLESLLGGAGGGDARALVVREQLLEWLPEAAAPLKQLGLLRKVARDRGVFLVPFDLRIE